MEAVQQSIDEQRGILQPRKIPATAGNMKGRPLNPEQPDSEERGRDNRGDIQSHGRYVEPRFGSRFSSADSSLYARAASVAGVLVDQRRQLDRRLSTGDSNRIDTLVHRLLELDGGAQANVVHLLESVLALAAPPSR